VANFLLIHGAWHGGWCWDRVVTLLEQQGHRVSAPTLAGLEQDRSDEVDGISLETHANDIVEAARSLRSPDLVVAGHSYAGFPLTAAADRLRGEVSRYLYLDAGVPEQMSVGSDFAWCDGVPPEQRKRRLAALVDQGLGPVLPPPPPEAFGVTQKEDLRLLEERLRPMPAGTFTDRVTLRAGGTEGLPRTYVHSVRPAYAPLGETPSRLAEDPTWDFQELESGHDSMLSDPEAVAAMLIRVANEAEGGT
jgi:pimeloyl-ACP methyl ester carboxylesterase